jgi:hypothetical protein
MSEVANIPELDIDPYSAENLVDPYPMHQRMREADPVVRLNLAVPNDAATFISSAGVGLRIQPRGAWTEPDP